MLVAKRWGEVGLFRGSPCTMPKLTRRKHNTKSSASTLARINSHLQDLEQALRASEPRVGVVAPRSVTGFPANSDPDFPLLILSELPLAVLVHDGRGRLVYGNHAFFALFGWELETLRTVSGLLRRVLPDAAERAVVKRALLKSALRQRPTLPLPAVTRDQRRLFLSVRIQRIAGKSTFATTIEDVTDQTQRSKAVFDSAQRLATTLDSIADAVITADAEGRLLRLNRVGESLTGWSQAEAVGRPLSEVFRISVQGNTEQSIGPAQLAAQSTRVPNEPLVLWDRRNQPHSVDVSAASVTTDEGESFGTVVVFRDVTEKRALEHRMRQTEKLESLGQLASGLAHEFNNLMAGTLNRAELLTLRLAESHDRAGQDELLGIIEATRSASQLVARVLSFARERPRQTAPVAIPALLRQVTDLLRRTLDRRIEIALQPDAEGATVRGDAQQLEDALVNLALNARDAMPDGGRLEISSRLVELSPAFTQRSVLPVEPGAYLEIGIRDTGTGIPSHHLGRIFEPFFTTKTARQGSGLGLSVVMATLRDHQGTLEVETESGRGTLFRLFLPLRSQSSIASDQPARDEVVTGEGRLLLVDDEPILRRTGAALLRRLGYEVEVAEDGRRALEVFHEHSGNFDLVLLDIVMPRLGGRETLRELRKLDPQVRAVYVSGYGLSHENPAVEDGVHAIVRKPFSLATLSQCIAEALAAPRTPVGLIS